MEIKILKKGNYAVFKQSYYDLQDFLNCLTTKPINYDIFSEPATFINGEADFYGTNTFEEAWNLCKFGYDNGFASFHELVNSIQFQFKNQEKIVKRYKPVGGSPSVERFLKGIPNNMHYRQKEYDRPIIDIYMNVSYHCNTCTEQIRNRGILVLSLIEYLEKAKNYKVNFSFFSASYLNDEIIYTTIPLKKWNETINIKKCYFPLVHPAFLRRLMFRSEEIIFGLQNPWNDGYGYPIPYKMVSALLELDYNNIIYISNPDELGIKGENIKEDSMRFIEIINQKYHILDDEKEKTKRK